MKRRKYMKKFKFINIIISFVLIVTLYSVSLSSATSNINEDTNFIIANYLYDSEITSTDEYVLLTKNIKLDQNHYQNQNLIIIPSENYSSIQIANDLRNKQNNRFLQYSAQNGNYDVTYSVIAELKINYEKQSYLNNEYFRINSAVSSYTRLDYSVWVTDSAVHVANNGEMLSSGLYNYNQKYDDYYTYTTSPVYDVRNHIMPSNWVFILNNEYATIAASYILTLRRSGTYTWNVQTIINISTLVFDV